MMLTFQAASAPACVVITVWVIAAIVGAVIYYRRRKS